MSKEEWFTKEMFLWDPSAYTGGMYDVAEEMLKEVEISLLLQIEFAKDPAVKDYLKKQLDDLPNKKEYWDWWISNRNKELNETFGENN